MVPRTGRWWPYLARPGLAPQEFETLLVPGDSEEVSASKVGGGRVPFEPGTANVPIAVPPTRRNTRSLRPYRGIWAGLGRGEPAFCQAFRSGRGPNPRFFSCPAPFAGILGEFRCFRQNHRATIASQKRRNVHLFRILCRDPIVAWPCNDRGPEGVGPSLPPARARLVAELASIFGGLTMAAGNQPETIASENGCNVHVLLLLRGNSIDSAYCNDRGWLGQISVSVRWRP